MSTAPSGLNELNALLGAIQLRRLSGVLSIVTPMGQWQLPILASECGYPLSDVHRIRRWWRALRRSCPQFRPGRGGIQLANRQEAIFWEHFTLARGVKADLLTLEQGKDAVRTAIKEMLFAAASTPQVQFNWRQLAWQVPEGVPSLFLPRCELTALMEVAQQLWQRWQQLEVPPEYCNRALILKPSGEMRQAVESSHTFAGLQPLFNGQRTFWDVDVKLQQSSGLAIQILRHFIQQGAIEFQELADYETSIADGAGVPLAVQKVRPLVLCVDDSLVACKVLENFVVQAGYRFAFTQDPAQALDLVRDRHPDFIFLDLVMPVTNGYELCAQIRRVEGYGNIPIAMLTGSDGFIDRVRARIVGATDFVSKPASEDKVVPLLQKHLPPKSKATVPETQFAC